MTNPLYCYVMLALGRAGEAGSSDMLCVFPGTGTGRAATGFTIRVDDSRFVNLTWGPPGGQDGYLLVASQAGGLRLTSLGSEETPPLIGGAWLVAAIVAIALALLGGGLALRRWRRAGTRL